MKYYKVKVKREARVGGGTHYVYPDNFNGKKFFGITYESAGDATAVEKRKDMAYEYILVEAPDSEDFSDVADTEEVDKVKKEELRAKWTPPAAEPI